MAVGGGGTILRIQDTTCAADDECRTSANRPVCATASCQPSDGICLAAPLLDDDACGVIDCDQLDSPCVDNDDLVTDRCTFAGLTPDDGFMYPHGGSAPTADSVGEYALTVTLKDAASNEVTRRHDEIGASKPFKISWDDPALVVDHGAVSDTRSRWGRGTPTELPVGAFSRHCAAGQSGTPVILKAADKVGTELRLSRSTPNTDGTWPRMQVWSYAAPRSPCRPSTRRAA